MRIGASDQAYEDFFRENDAYQVEIVPAYRDGVVDGFYRFEYISPNDDYRGGLLLLEAAMAIMFLCVMGILLYLKYKLIAPFYRLSTLPGELAKGHLKTEIKEEKSRFFWPLCLGDQPVAGYIKRYQKEGAGTSEAEETAIVVAVTRYQNPSEHHRLIRQSF